MTEEKKSLKSQLITFKVVEGDIVMIATTGVPKQPDIYSIFPIEEFGEFIETCKDVLKMVLEG